MISSLTEQSEHMRKCLKVEYLGRISYDFQKSRVTGPWDHKDSVSAKKFKKMSCLCTFKSTDVRITWKKNGVFKAKSEKLLQNS
jgi:hypothetical protein